MRAVIRRFGCRLLNAVRPARGEAGLEREITSHLALLEDHYRGCGQSADEARRSARLALGGVTQTQDICREARSFNVLDNLRRDLVYAVRMLRRRPVASLAAVLSLAVGIGLTAAAFSVVDWVLLRPLPYP